MRFGGWRVFTHASLFGVDVYCDKKDYLNRTYKTREFGYFRCPTQLPIPFKGCRERPALDRPFVATCIRPCAAFAECRLPLSPLRPKTSMPSANKQTSTRISTRISADHVIHGDQWIIGKLVHEHVIVR